MCGILASTNKETVESGLKILENRGKDDTSIKEVDSYFLGHNLHAIVNKIPQPITHQGTLVANCEIYNWKSLAKEHTIQATNDADLLCQLLDTYSVSIVLEMLDGVYAFIYKKDNIVIATRDLLGVKPLWFTKDGSFASENKALGFKGEEVNPRDIIYYDTEKNSLFTQEKLFYTLRVMEGTEEELVQEATDLFKQAVVKRIPDTNIKVGILLSGGVDSTMIAVLCKKLGYETHCYTAVLDNPQGEDPHDLTASLEVAKKYELNHHLVKATKEDIPSLTKTVSTMIESTDAVKVAVGIPFYLCAQQAAKDGCKVLFSGLGAEEIMAGYQRHKVSDDINDECLKGLEQLHERDLYRDDILTMNSGVELRLPFLDRSLVEFSLTVPSDLKIKDEHQKYLLRKVAQKIGLADEDAFRPKKAAQYGSRFDRALQKVAKAQGFETRSEFIESLQK